MPETLTPPASVDASRSPAAGTLIGAPVAAGQRLIVYNGYDYPPPSAPCPTPGAPHDHCGNQEDGLDLIISDPADARLLAPVNGVVGWVGKGAMACLGIWVGGTTTNLTVCHFAAGGIFVAKGHAVSRGEVLGLRDPNAWWVHLNLDDRSTSTYLPIPFDGDYALEGVSMSAPPPAVLNRYCGLAIESSTTPAPGDPHLSPSPYATFKVAPPLACGPAPGASGASSTPSASHAPPTPSPTSRPSPTADMTCAALRQRATQAVVGSDAWKSNAAEQLSLGCEVYASSDQTLYLVETATGAFQALGSYGGEGSMLDIARAPGGGLYGLAESGTRFVRIDPWKATVTVVGPTSVATQLNGLVVTSAGRVYASGGGELFRIDPSTGTATVVGSTGGWSSAGDLAVLSSGVMILASSQLVRVDATSGAGTGIGSTSVSCLWGLSATPAGLFGGTCNGELLRLSASTGTYSVIASGLPEVFGLG